MERARLETGELNRFFNWAYRTRGNTVKSMLEGKMMSPEKIFLSFTSHDPVFISNGPAGLNGSVKGIGFIPREEYLEEALAAYVEHIKTYDPEDKTYSNRGLELLMKWLYSEEAEKTVDFSHIYSVEMAFKHSWANYQVNPEATLMFYQPPILSYEVRGKMEIVGEHNEMGSCSPFELPLIQQFINAQHDVYHAPNIERWVTRPAYKFTIEEIFDNSANKQGFGTQIPY
ncbi:MAG: hypothetical protein E7644_00140 [Ruminococcaceae bacterium]|nr:hypothetical protein [Oscillospiraceae bacterium]